MSERAVQVLGSVLSRTMLLSIEVAVEYWLSLTWSPQAQWLCDSTHDSPLRDEVSRCRLSCAALESPLICLTVTTLSLCSTKATGHTTNSNKQRTTVLNFESPSIVIRCARTGDLQTIQVAATKNK